MDVIILFAHILWLTLSGAVLFYFMTGDRRQGLDGLFAVGGGIGLAFGLLSWWLFLCGVFDIFRGPTGSVVFYLFIVALVVLIMVKKLPSNQGLSFCRQSLKTSTIWESALLCIVAFYVFFIWISALTVPISSWDAWATIAFKAKIFFYERSFAYNAHLPHPSYPLLTPLLQTWTAFTIGRWDEFLTKIIFPLFGTAYIAIHYGFLKRVCGRTLALLGTVFLISSFSFVLFCSLGYRDIILTYYNCAAVILLYTVFYENKGFPSILAAGLFSGFAAFTKLEGIGYVFIHAVLAAGLLWRRTDISIKLRLKQFACFVAPPVIIIVFYWLFKQHAGIALGEGGKTEIILTVDVFQRLKTIAAAFYQNLFVYLNWSWNWYFLLGLCIFSFKKRFSSGSRFFITSIFLFLLADCALLLFTPNYKYILDGQLLSRLILHFFPLCPIASVFLLFDMKFLEPDGHKQSC